MSCLSDTFEKLNGQNAQMEFLQAQIEELKALNDFLVQLNEIGREALRQKALVDNFFSFSPRSKDQTVEGRSEQGTNLGDAA